MTRRRNPERIAPAPRRPRKPTQKDRNNEKGHSLNPVNTLLSRRANKTHRTVKWALAKVATLALRRTVKHPETVRWHKLTYRHGIRVREGIVEGQYSVGSGNLMLSVWRQILKEAWRCGLMAREEFERAADIETIHGDPLPRGRALSRDEVARLLVAAREDLTAGGRRDALIVALGVHGGLRREEMARLELGDVDAATGRVKVHGKGRRERVVTVTRTHACLVTAWLEVRGEEPGPLLWVSARGRLNRLMPGHGLTGSSVWSIVARLAARAGLPRTTPHDLRRTCATELRRRGMDIAQVGAYLGHSKLDTTRIYTRDDDALADLVEGAWR